VEKPLSDLAASRIGAHPRRANSNARTLEVTEDTEPRHGSKRTAARLTRRDFERSTLEVARALLGAFVVVRASGAGMITEVEAYKGPRDLACHARLGRRTPRTEPLYGPGGTVYVYLVYGLHWLLNFSTAGREKPEAVLVRAVLLENGERVTGPGRVTRRLAIDGRFDGLDVTTSPRIRVEDRGVRVPSRLVRRGPRIGVDYAGPFWASRPWRFWIEPETATRSIVAARSQRPG